MQRIAVCFGQFSIVGKTVSGFVFRQDFVYLLDVGVHFIQQGFVFLGDWRAEQIYDFLRAVHISLEVAQIGVAVTIFFARDFAAGHFFNQSRRAANHFGGWEVQFVDFGLQFFHVFQQFVGNGLHAFHVFFNPQRVFNAVEASEVRVFRAVFKVVFTRVNRRVKLVEQFGNRLNALVVNAG